MEKRVMEKGWPCAAEPCGDAPQWHDRVSENGEAVVVPLVCARWRGRQGEASGVDEFAPEGL